MAPFLREHLASLVAVEKYFNGVWKQKKWTFTSTSLGFNSADSLVCILMYERFIERAKFYVDRIGTNTLDNINFKSYESYKIYHENKDITFRREQ